MGGEREKERDMQGLSVKLLCTFHMRARTHAHARLHSYFLTVPLYQQSKAQEKDCASKDVLVNGNKTRRNKWLFPCLTVSVHLSLSRGQSFALSLSHFHALSLVSLSPSPSHVYRLFDLCYLSTFVK